MNYEDMTPEQKREYGFVKLDPAFVQAIRWQRRLEARRQRDREQYKQTRQEDRMLRDRESRRIISETKSRRRSRGDMQT